MQFRQMVPTLALSVLALGAACTPADEAEEVDLDTDTEALNPPPAATPGLEVDDPAEVSALMTSTIQAAEGGLTNLAPDAAVEVIEEWQETLSDAGDPEIAAINEDLEFLQEALAEDPLDVPAIGDVLMRLGDQTTTVAGTADPVYTDNLTRLGTLLSEAGQMLSGM